MASSGGNFVLDKGYDAAAAIVKYTAVKLSASETVTPVTAEGDVVLGFAQFGVTTAEIAKGKGASVRLFGITQAVVGAGGVTLGTMVCIAGDGTVVAANTGGRAVGICLNTGAVGDYVSVTFVPGLPLL